MFVGTGDNNSGGHKDTAVFQGCCGPGKPGEVQVTLTQWHELEFGCRTAPVLPGRKKWPSRTWTGLTVPQTEPPPAPAWGSLCEPCARRVGKLFQLSPTHPETSLGISQRRGRRGVLLLIL